jgi:hypothetical protein
MAPTDAFAGPRSSALSAKIETPAGGDAGVSRRDDQRGGTRSSPEHEIGWIVLRSILLMADLIAPP